MQKFTALSNRIHALRAERDEILTKQEVAARLKISLRTLDSWLATGRIGYFKLGRSVRFRWSAVLEKLEAYRVG